MGMVNETSRHTASTPKKLISPEAAKLEVLFEMRQYFEHYLYCLTNRTMMKGKDSTAWKMLIEEQEAQIDILNAEIERRLI